MKSTKLHQYGPWQPARRPPPKRPSSAAGGKPEWPASAFADTFGSYKPQRALRKQPLYQARTVPKFERGKSSTTLFHREAPKMGLQVGRAPAVTRTLSSGLLATGSVSSFVTRDGLAPSTMSPRSMSAATLLPSSSCHSFQADGSFCAGASASSLHGMERQSVRELRKAAQDAAADPFHSYGQHAAQRLAEESWEDDGFGVGSLAASAPPPPSASASSEPRRARAPPTRIHPAPLPMATVAVPDASLAERMDCSAPSNSDASLAERGAEPDTGGAELAAELRFLREENARLLERQALLEDMAAKAWSDHSAEAPPPKPRPSTSPRGPAADVLDAIDNTPPTSPSTTPAPLPASGARRSTLKRAPRRSTEAGQAADGGRDGEKEEEVSAIPISSPSASGHAPTSPMSSDAIAAIAAASSSPSSMSTPAVPNAFSLASGSPFDKKPSQPPRLVRVRLGATLAAHLGAAPSATRHGAMPQRRIVQLRLCAAGSSEDVDDAEPRGAEAATKLEADAMRLELENLRGQLAAAADGARTTSESADAEIAELRAEMEQLKAQLQRSRVERTRAGLALEKAAETNRKAMMTPVQIYTVFLLGYAKGRLKTEQDLQRQHEELQMLLRDDDEPDE